MINVVKDPVIDMLIVVFTVEFYCFGITMMTICAIEIYKDWNKIRNSVGSK
jgi:hypothetical protein